MDDRVPDVLAAEPQLEPTRTHDETPTPDKAWPQAAPLHSRVYGFQDPMWGAVMVAMTIETWEKWFREAAQMRKDLKELKANRPRIVLPNGGA